MSRPYLAVAAIFRDEAPYLAEWVAFHRAAGVEEFYLYDNESTDGGADVVRATGAPARVYDWPGERAQYGAYQDALRRPEHRARWVAFVDVDEFLYSPTLQPLPTVLRRYERHPAVGACWALYGTSDHRTRQPSVLRAYTLRSRRDVMFDLIFDDGVAKMAMNSHVKSIIQPALAPGAAPVTAHCFSCGGVDELERPLAGSFAPSPTWRFLRVNHYWPRSEQEALAKSQRPRADDGSKQLYGALASPALNVVRDTEILSYLERLGGARP